MSTTRPQSNHKKVKFNGKRRHGTKAPQESLRGMLPRAGMIYPFREALLRTKRGDIAITTAIQRSLGVPFATTAILNTVFSRIFEEATELLQQVGGTQFANDPMEFIRALLARPGLQEPWRRRNISLFTKTVLVLRAARKNWHDTPREPYKVEQHCKLGRAIDAYLAIESLSWNNFAALSWLVGRGLDIVRPDRNHHELDEEMPDDTGENKSESRDSSGKDPVVVYGTTVGKTPDMEKISGANGSAAAVGGPAEEFHISFDQVVAGMRRLNLEVDESALTQAFADLRIDDEAGVSRSPALEDSDGDIVMTT